MTLGDKSWPRPVAKKNSRIFTCGKGMDDQDILCGCQGERREEKEEKEERKGDNQVPRRLAMTLYWGRYSLHEIGRDEGTKEGRKEPTQFPNWDCMASDIMCP